LNKLSKHLHETGTTAIPSLESIQKYLLFSYCVIFIHRLDIIKGISHLFANVSAAILLNIVKIGQYLTE